MVLPRGDEYNMAIQNPRIAFTDIELKNGSVETTPLGLPKPYSGGFTITYKLINPQKSWAVRCFHRDIQDLQQRYQAIGSFLAKNQSRYFVDAKYLAEGIKVNGKGYPIIKMLWLDGEPLNIYLSKAFSQKTQIETLLSDFVSLINELERLGIAHGDLQHGNIIVKSGKLSLIDYDGMYFPELASLKTNEIGHINYQHPKRSASHYNQNIDRFSAIVIYLGLKAISISPDLWRKYDNSENILFRSQDFADLQHSLLIQDLSAIPKIKPLVEQLIGCCHLEFEKVPSLKDFLSGNFAYNKNAVGTITISRSQYVILDGSRSGSILEHFGEKVEIVGIISGNHSGFTYSGSSYMFLNFGRYPNQTFTLVIWQEGINALNAKGMSPSSLVGKYVSVTGVIGTYGGKPQMIIELPTQIQILSGKIAADQRLSIKPIKNAPSTPLVLPPKGVVNKEKNVFDNLYGNRPIYTPPKPLPPVTPKPVTHSAPIYKPPTSTHNKPPITPQKSNDNGCAVPIIFAVLGAIVIGAVSEGKFWFLGVIVGGVLGLWIQSWFK
jgi:hypothetical protein